MGDTKAEKVMGSSYYQIQIQLALREMKMSWPLSISPSLVMAASKTEI
jgi:hypothetical protein